MRPTFTAAPLVAALLLLAAACAPDQSGGGAGEPPGGEAELAHAQCMRDHGIDWPDPVFVDGGWEIRPGADVDLESPAFKEAETACAQVLEDAAPAGGGDPDDRARVEEEMERMLTFAACMRAEGIEFPDPVLEDDGVTISGPAGPVDGDQAAFDAARQTCEERTGAAMP